MTMGLLLLSIFILSGCHSLLGIEDRKLDTQELTEQGYSGCEPARRSCTACTSKWHECICDGWQTLPEAELRLECARDHAPAAIRDEVIAEAEDAFERYQAETSDGGSSDDAVTDDATTDDATTDAVTDEPATDVTDGTDTTDPLPALCLGANGTDECITCFCDKCSDELSACDDNEDCRAIFDCIGEYDCDPFPVVGSESCYQPQYCGPLIDASGGIDGEGHDLFRLALDCNIVNACPCGEQPSECWPEAGCKCGTCWESCLCEGRPDSECIDRCSDPDCGSDGTCASCNDCVDDCLCKGQWDLFYCTELCRPGDSCTQERGCFCGDCMNDCTCIGESLNQCRQWCDPCTPSGGCDCGGDCYSECYCEGNDADTCDARCDTSPCSPNGGCDCPDCSSECACMGFGPASCNDQCLDACSPQGGCDCGACYDDCLCQGNGPGYCNDLCYPPACSPVNGCACDTCYDGCLCNGNDSIYCNDLCYPVPCSVAGGCDCGSCYSDCLCNGYGDSYCNDTCYPPACSPAGGCNCADCTSECICNGNDANYCDDYCVAQTCTPTQGCICGDCQADCECNGGDAITCETQCATGSFPDCANYDTCQGCFTCAGSCACADTGAFAGCLQTCEVSGCTAGDCTSCQSCQARCECEGGDPQICLDDCTGMMTCKDLSFDYCEECACESCTTEYRICDETSGCRQLLTCMSQFECTNIRDCYQPALCQGEIDAMGGLSSPSMQIAESVQLCRVESGCPCYRSKLEEPVTCGALTCYAYVYDSVAPVAPACCTGSSADECGLETRYLLEGAAGCQPLSAPGAIDTECTSLFPPGPPYFGDELQGCCRTDGFCGFSDTTMGLGCIDAAAFGLTTGPCGTGGAGGGPP